MSKFKVGDKAKCISLTDIACATLKIGEVVTIEGYYNAPRLEVTYHGGIRGYGSDDNFELITTQGDKPMARRTFKLLKDTPSMKKGALLQEESEDGTQPYSLISTEHIKGSQTDKPMRFQDRSLVEDAPNWFVEVFKVTPEYMTREELDKFEEFKNGGKPVKKKRTWTAAQRKAQSERVKARHAAKK